MIKGERRRLKNEIKELQNKIDTHNEQILLKGILSDSLEKTNQVLAAIGSLEDKVKSESAKVPDENEEKLLIPKIFSDPNTFQSTKTASHLSLVKHRDEIKLTVDRLTKIIETGLDGHRAEIVSKQQRIEEINERLKVIRQKEK